MNAVCCSISKIYIKTKKVHDDSIETAQPVLESVSNSKLINSILQSAVEDMKLACKANSMPGMNSDVLLKKNTILCFNLLIV